AQTRVIFVEPRDRFVGGTIVDNDQLEARISLSKHGLDGLADHRPSVIGRNDDADSWDQGITPVAGSSSLVAAPLPSTAFGGSDSGSDKGFHFLEKLIHHHLRHAAHHALANAGDESADFGVGAVF